MSEMIYKQNKTLFDVDSRVINDEKLELLEMFTVTSNELKCGPKFKALLFSEIFLIDRQISACNINLY